MNLTRRCYTFCKLAEVFKNSTKLSNRCLSIRTISSQCNFTAKYRNFTTANAAENVLDGEKREFQAETRMLLDIVAKSLYSDKEVFIRELISNASDALEKCRYLILTNEITDIDRKLEINIETDKLNRLLIVKDTGVGMTKDELVNNLGTIARSGSKAFLENLKKDGVNADNANNIIGQFGVGFYSAFMVSNKVEVYTRSSKDTQGWNWCSDRSGTYEIKPADNVEMGTKIIMHLKPDCREFAEEDVIQKVIKKYSNFVGSPIVLNGNKVNTIEPIWLKNAKDITPEQHNEFYRYISNSYDTPRYTLHYSTDAPLSIRALIYFPEGKPGLFEMSRDYETGISLYTRKVLIKNKADNLLPKYLRFLKGVVDCEDIPLNLSRELLQNNRLIGNLRSALTTKVLKFLNDQMTKNLEKYNQFYLEYNPFLKEGIVTIHDFQEKEEIAKLLRFESANTPEGQNISLTDYVKNLKENQKDIYYIASPSRKLAESSPYYESVKLKNVDVLFCYDPYDELVLMQLRTFKNHVLKSTEMEMRQDKTSTNISDLGENSLRRTQIEELSKWLKNTLDGRVENVRAVSNLETHPCVITVEEMGAARHFLRTTGHNLPQKEQFALLKPQLDINPKNPLIQKLHKFMTEDEKFAQLLANQLFLNAMVGAGLVQNAQTVVQSMNELLTKALEKI
nr:tumor necrosis factor receptor-associated protein 1 [Protohermes costalis]